jgi:hypothetical protein
MNKPEPTLPKSFAILWVLCCIVFCVAFDFSTLFWPFHPWYSGFAAAAIWPFTYWRGFELGVWIEKQFSQTD